MDENTNGRNTADIIKTAVDKFSLQLSRLIGIGGDNVR
jgi:hypothetical protein